MDLILKYFPNITDKQRSQFEQLLPLYTEWNEQINVISRKDLDNFYERHVLHSLAIARYIRFSADADVLDVGTGGGFPGIPLAIMFPDTNFTLVDSIGKKIKVVNEVSRALGLKNVTGIHCRAEEVDGQFDFVVSRAVTRMNKFIPWVQGKIRDIGCHELMNGILYLKGGDLDEELAETGRRPDVWELAHDFDEPFFETKKLVHIPLFD